MTAQGNERVFVGSSELALLMRQTDWGHTAAGPIEHWPQSVRAILRMMLTSRYAMWMGWGPKLTFFYNDAYATMTLGAKHPWALGRPAHEVWAEIWPDIGPRIGHVLATGEATWDEGLQLFLERSGFPEETYHTFSYSPLHDDDGTIGGMFCVVTEETDRLIGERRLGLLRELGVHLTSSQTTDDIWAALKQSLATAGARDLPFTLTYLIDPDEARLTLAGATNISPEDSRLQDPAGPDGLFPIRSILDGASTSQVFDLDPAVQWPSGPWQRPPTRAMAVAIPQQGRMRPAGVFIAGLNPFRPVDAAYESFVRLYVGQLAAALANAHAHADERRRAEALAEIDRAKTTFFSNVSHELRTPLTLMLAPVADALASHGQALSADSLELVYRNGLRLRKLVNALLEFSRIEAGRMQATYVPLDLARLTAEVASAFESVIDRADLRYVIDMESGGDPTYVDREMWEKIVLNLISNAFKYTLQGEIAVTLTRRPGQMCLQVRDTGVGIPARELPRIFDRFHRVDSARGRTQEGTGIGLALVQEFVKLHDGAITVDSAEGTGSTFTVTIPTGSAHLPADRISTALSGDGPVVAADPLSEVEQWLAGSTEMAPLDVHAAGGVVESARIVLADDNTDMRTYLSRLLRARWHVDVAHDGEHALELARTIVPDLIVTDVMMPKLDGFGLLRALRGDERTRHIPVMVLSARAGEESRVEGFEAGADDYLVKPFGARELVARVEAQLLRARVRAVEDEHRRRVAAVFSHAPVAIAVLRGPEHTYESANAQYLDLIGRRQVVGLSIRDALPELAGQGIYELLDRVRTTGEPYAGRSLRVELLAREGTGTPDERYFDFVYQPVLDVHGSVDAIAVVCYDVTELTAARREAEVANRAKDEFLAMLGHELRNPLAPIVTALQLLRLRGVQVGEREHSIIERQVRHLVGLVDDLLDVSRITRGKVRLNRVPLLLSEAIAKGVEAASPLLEQHQHNLTIDVPASRLGVHADPVRLAQIVTNLLTNAAKYTSPGGDIRISAARDGDEVVIRVADTGIGMDHDMLSRVFDLFIQDRQAIDRAQGGLGLGLAIVRSLVELHGGSVSAFSEGRGRGSEFVVRLPYLSIDTHAPVSDAVDLPLPQASGLRVLVVDDNEDAAQLLAEALALSGHQTATAHDGPNALEIAERLKPHVALLDLGLPVMDGFELARLMKSRAALQATRLIAVTGYGQENDRRRTAAEGFVTHLVKPVDIQHLANLIKELAPTKE